MAGGGGPHWPDVRWARHKSSAKPRKRCGCRLELITQRRVWLTADHALDRICLMVPVDAHLDRLFLFNWIRAKSGGHTTGAGAHRAHVHLAVEAIGCPYRGRVRTFKFPSLLGLRTPIEGYSSHFIGRSGCFFAGAVVGQSIFDTAVFNRSATRPADQANLPEPKAVSTIIVRTEPVKSPVQPTSSDQAQDLTELNELKEKIWEAEVAQRNFAAGLPHCSELNGTNFYFSKQNRLLNLQDYRRSLDNLVTQGVFNRQDADARWAQVQKQATTDQANCTAVASLPSLRQKLKELQQRP